MILIGTGSEVSLCVGAAEQLAAEGVPPRIVSMPSWELFEQQDAAYQGQVLPEAIAARVAVEQAATLRRRPKIADSEFAILLASAV